MPKTKSDTNSTTSSIARFAIAFPTSRLERESGDASKASRHSFGNSRAKPRLKTSAPAKANTSQSRPPAMSRVSSEVTSNTKLNSSRMAMANAPAAFSDSFVRSSMARSLRAMESACRTVLISAGPQPSSRPYIHVSPVKESGIVQHLGRPLACVAEAAVFHESNVRCDGKGFAELVGRENDGCAPLASFGQQIAQH